MKKLIFAIITLGVLLGLTWIVSDFMRAKMIDYAFFVGLIVTIIIRFLQVVVAFFQTVLVSVLNHRQV